MREQDVAPIHLMRLAAQAMMSFLGQAPKFEVEGRAGVWKMICGEPVADLNYIMVERDDAAAIDALQSMVADLVGRDLPFCCMLAPGTETVLGSSCESAGLTYAVDWPLMVCPAEAVEAHTRADVEIAAVRTDADAGELARLLAGAFHMPEDAVRRTLPHTVTDVPGLDVFLARVEDGAASTVTVTRHDHVAGIWAMGTPPELQGKGVGKVLLSQVMTRYRDAGVEAFFLGATPAGRPLYEKLGYREVARAQVWVRGETHQA
jgi:GNAT superfamily N-acetyltransferase